MVLLTELNLGFSTPKCTRVHWYAKGTIIENSFSLGQSFYTKNTIFFLKKSLFESENMLLLFLNPGAFKAVVSVQDTVKSRHTSVIFILSHVLKIKAHFTE